MNIPQMLNTLLTAEKWQTILEKARIETKHLHNNKKNQNLKIWLGLIPTIDPC